MSVPDPADSPAVCSGCGLAIVGGDAACQALVEQLWERDYSGVVAYPLHRLCVDTYALQHPERYCASGKSLAAHLCGMLVHFEGGGSPKLQMKLRAWLDGAWQPGKPELPALRGGLRVDSAMDIDDVDAYGKALDAWAASVWQAYYPLREVARTWLAAALQHPRR